MRRGLAGARGKVISEWTWPDRVRTRRAWADLVKFLDHGHHRAFGFFHHVEIGGERSGGGSGRRRHGFLRGLLSARFGGPGPASHHGCGADDGIADEKSPT